MKNTCTFILKCLLFLAIIAGKPVCAQTFEEFKKQEAEKLKKYEKEQDNYLANMRKDYEAFVIKRDKEFADFLKKEWKPYQVEAGQPQPEKPKPQSLPEYKTRPNQPIEEIKPVLSKSAPTLVPNAKPCPLIQMPIRKPLTPVSTGVPLNIDFYGVPVFIDSDPAFNIYVANKVDKVGIADYWAKASNCNYAPLVEELLSQKDVMNLNDYTYYLLIKKVAESIYPQNTTGQTLPTEV